MSRSDVTRLHLETSLQRILAGSTKRISAHRTISVRSVEEEANLGNGSAYYYPEIIEKIKAAKLTAKISKVGLLPYQDIQRLRESKLNEVKIKNKYRIQVKKLKLLLQQMAAEHHQMAQALYTARSHIEMLKREVSELRKKKVVQIK